MVKKRHPIHEVMESIWWITLSHALLIAVSLEMTLLLLFESLKTQNYLNLAKISLYLAYNDCTKTIPADFLWISNQ